MIRTGFTFVMTLATPTPHGYCEHVIEPIIRELRVLCNPAPNWFYDNGSTCTVCLDHTSARHERIPKHQRRLE